MTTPGGTLKEYLAGHPDSGQLAFRRRRNVALAWALGQYLGKAELRWCSP